MRDAGLEGIQAIIQRQQRVLTESDDGGFFFLRQNRRIHLLRPHRSIVGESAFLPLGDSLRVDPVLSGQRVQALLTMLYCSTHSLCRAGASV